MILLPRLIGGTVPHVVRHESFIMSKQTQIVPAVTRADLFKDCQRIAESGDALKLLEAQLQGCGYSGDTRLIKLLLLASVTRLFGKPVSVIIKGEASTGKSHAIKTLRAFLPNDAYVLRSGSSPKAVIYSKEDCKHKHIILEELAGLDEGNVWVRTLLSEGEINYETVDQNQESKVIKKEGPTGLIATTTKRKIYKEDDTRYLCWDIQDDLQSLDASLMSSAKAAEGHSPASYDFPDWRAFGNWLAMGPSTVVIPFATQIVTRMKKIDNRQRRDWEQLKSLIMAHALMNQCNRATDTAGQILAKVEDYGAVRDLVIEVFGQSIEATVPEPIKQVAIAVTSVTTHRADYKDGAPLGVIAEKIKRDKGSTSRRVAEAVDWGLVVDVGAGLGYPRKLKPGNPIPQSQDIFPTVEDLRAAIAAAEQGAA